MIGSYELDRVHEADCLKALRRLPDDSVDCCVTSPPYWGLRSYGGPSTTWGLGHEVCEHRWVSGGLRGGSAQRQGASGQLADRAAATDRRRERHEDDLGRSCALCGAWEGLLGQEPTPDLYVRHLVEVFEEVRRVLVPTGTLWLSLGASFASGGTAFRDTGFKPKDLVPIPWMVAMALRTAGWYLRADIIWHKPNGMPTSVTDRPTCVHEYLFLLARSARYFYDAAAIREPTVGSRRGLDGGTRNRRSVWSVSTGGGGGRHIAIMPEKLVEPCILAGCPEGGVVLDPFAGSGTVGAVAQRLGRRSIGFEIVGRNADDANRRIGRKKDDDDPRTG